MTKHQLIKAKSNVEVFELFYQLQFQNNNLRKSFYKFSALHLLWLWIPAFEMLYDSYAVKPDL